MDKIKFKHFRRPLEDALTEYEAQSDLIFDDFPDIYTTEGTPNTARTIIPVRHGAKKVGDMYAIVFAKGDSTGKTTDFRVEELMWHPEHRVTDKPEDLVPRKKTGVITEGFFPFFSMTSIGYAAMFAASLDELTIVDNTITKLWGLGLDDAEYSKALAGEVLPSPQVYKTVGDLEGERLGDPHSIYFDKRIADAIQVVGFLSITDKELPEKLYKGWKFPEF